MNGTVCQSGCMDRCDIETEIDTEHKEGNEEREERAVDRLRQQTCRNTTDTDGKGRGAMREVLLYMGVKSMDTSSNNGGRD